MTESQKEYYHKMIKRNRGLLLVEDDRLVGIVTFAVGSNDQKYLYSYEPWTILDDDPNGDTIYIQQLISDGGLIDHARRERKYFMDYLKARFPNAKKMKWARVDAQYRKNGIIEGVRVHVHSQDLE